MVKSEESKNQILLSKLGVGSVFSIWVLTEPQMMEDEESAE